MHCVLCELLDIFGINRFLSLVWWTFEMKWIQSPFKAIGDVFPGDLLALVINSLNKHLWVVCSCMHHVFWRNHVWFKNVHDYSPKYILMIIPPKYILMIFPKIYTHDYSQKYILMIIPKNIYSWLFPKIYTHDYSQKYILMIIPKNIYSWLFPKIYTHDYSQKYIPMIIPKNIYPWLFPKIYTHCSPTTVI